MAASAKSLSRKQYFSTFKERFFSPLAKATDDFNKAAWLETWVVSFLFMAVSWWVRPDDPFLLQESFPWLLIAPLFLALRHGFVFGFLSVLAWIALIIAAERFAWLGSFDFPDTLILGSLIVTMLTGEFSDYWRKRLGRTVVENEQRMRRMEEFTRSYHLLKVSHDQLVEQMAGSTVSLRQAIIAVRHQVLKKKDGRNPIVSEAQDIIQLFRSYASVQAASLYQVSAGALEVKPLAVVGAVPEVGSMLQGSDMVKEALQTGKMMSVVTGDNGMPRYVEGNILAAVPICDLHEQTRALLIIYRIPFLKLNMDNLSLIALMGGYLGDLLYELETLLQDKEDAEAAFMAELERSIHYAKKYQMKAQLVSVEMPCAGEALKQLLSMRRSLDKPYTYTNKEGMPVVLWLMPFTDAYGVAGFQARINLWAEQYFVKEYKKNTVYYHVFPITAQDGLKVLMKHVGDVCDLADT